MANPKTPKDVIAMAKEAGALIVDLRFTDLPGQVQHLSLPIHELTDEKFADGQPFDGSSVRGFQEIQESDMLLELDPTTAYMDPFTKHPTLNITCFVKDPITGEDYSRDPRNIAKKAELYLQQTGIADTAFFGPEAEFYIFDSIRYDQNEFEGYYHVDSIAGAWKSGSVEEGGNLGYKTRYKGGYFALPPMDKYQDLRTDMVLHLERGRAHDRGAPPRGRHRRPGRDRHALRHAADHRGQRHEVQVRGQEHGLPGRQDGHLHAEAAVHGQRFGHAHAPEPVDGRRAAVLGRGQLRRDQRPGALVHRRPDRARAGAARVHEPDHQLLPTPGARLRGADHARVLAAEPQRVRADPGRRARARRPSGSSSARRTRRATRTSRSRRC